MKLYETVNEHEKRTGEKYHELQGVFFNGGKLDNWEIFTYQKAKEMCEAIKKYNPIMIVLTAKNIKNRPHTLHLSK